MSVARTISSGSVSVLFNEPKLLKSGTERAKHDRSLSFSALQRAEIAEIQNSTGRTQRSFGFSALQRAEIAEIGGHLAAGAEGAGFSALQRAEIAEMRS